MSIRAAMGWVDGMIPIGNMLAFTLASVVIIVVPGPSDLAGHPGDPAPEGARRRAGSRPVVVGDAAAPGLHRRAHQPEDDRVLGLTQGAGWLLIEDTSEPAAPSFWVRTGTAQDGRVILTGILLADADASLEVTTNALRAIRVPEVVRAIHWRAVGGPPPASVGEVGPTGLARFEGVAQAIENAPQPAPVPPKRGQVATDDDLRAIVEEYRKHRWSPSPIAATEVALRAQGMPWSRATIQRRLDLAHGRGIFSEGRRGRPSTTERSTR